MRKLAGVISPWTVGRCGTPAQAARHAERTWTPDLAWCAQQKLDYLPADFYLKLTGAGAKMLRGELPVTTPLPKP